MKKRLLIYGLLVIVLFAMGCSETRHLMRYDMPEQDLIWPVLPDKPRYQLVGYLTGEDNFQEVEGSGPGASIGRFFKALVGLGSENERVRTLLRPQSGTVDDQGRVIVTDAGRQSVFVFDEKQGKMSIWTGATEEFNFVSPVGIDIAKNGDVLVADAELRRVIRLDSQGNPKSEFGFDDLERPTGLAIDKISGRIFVSDTGENNLKVYDDNGTLIQVIGQVGIKKGEFNAPTHISFKNGKLYVTDTFNARIQVFDSKGIFLQSIGSRGLYMGNLVRPKGVAADSQGNVYIIESFHDYLLVYDQDRRFLMPIGGTGSGAGQFYLPAGAWSDQEDRIYVADMYNRRVAIFQYLQGSGRKGSGLTRLQEANTPIEASAQTDVK
ncbi:MAG: 6-bladed beta-propeller [Ectothiorhodospiraceae bacterium]|nr:6-bladed beta-propeller [Ectothiorhodospiraceae bacterium]